MILGNIINPPQGYNHLKSVNPSGLKNTPWMSNLPTLIVGYKLAKELYPEEFHINNPKVADNLFWVVSPKRDRMVYEKGFEAFFETCVDFHINKFKYRYYDLMLEPISKINFKKIHSYTQEGDLYYFKYNKHIISVSKPICGILGYNIDSIIADNQIIEHHPHENFVGYEGAYRLCF